MKPKEPPIKFYHPRPHLTQQEFGQRLGAFFEKYASAYQEAKASFAQDFAENPMHAVDWRASVVVIAQVKHCYTSDLRKILENAMGEENCKASWLAERLAAWEAYLRNQILSYAAAGTPSPVSRYQAQAIAELLRDSSFHLEALIREYPDPHEPHPDNDNPRMASISVETNLITRQTTYEVINAWGELVAIAVIPHGMRKAKREAIRAQLKAWAQENYSPVQYIEELESK